MTKPNNTELRQQIEAIYLNRLPNQDTGLYDFRSSIDDLIELFTTRLENAVAKAGQEGYKMGYIAGNLDGRVDASKLQPSNKERKALND